jgi:gamma-glutamyltranspeptidase/glutathione hydrolase
VIGTRGMVVSDDRVASEWGAEILRRGGNAADAASATVFALAVTRPYFASLGGGGFLIYCPAPDANGTRPCSALDFREEAPGKSQRRMYVKNGNPDTRLSQNGATASGVPGVPAGLLALIEKFGTKSRAEILARPIALAEQGFSFSGLAASSSMERWPSMNAEAKSIFGCVQNSPSSIRNQQSDIQRAPCPPGAVVKQPDLAQVLAAISKAGRAGFYQGWVAQKLAGGVQKAGGILNVDDLKSYQPKWREVIRGNYDGMEVVSMPPPSSGGILLMQLLGFTERADKQKALDGGFGSVMAIHALTYAMSLAFADRAQFLGDPDFTKVPKDRLLSPSYLDQRWSSFDPQKATLATGPGDLSLNKEPMHTTHVAVIDRQGNAVSMTVTVNNYWGSGFVPPGTGVVMNDQMDDFSIQPGVPNMFGLIGAEANAIAPHKRPLSSMMPTIVRDLQGHSRIVIGAEGGPRIITSVFLSLVNRLRFGMALPDAVAAPRFHHQWRPKDLYIEPFGFPMETQAKLREMGYNLKELSAFSVVDALEVLPNGRVVGVPDIRGEGAAVPE